MTYFHWKQIGRLQKALEPVKAKAMLTFYNLSP